MRSALVPDPAVDLDHAVAKLAACLNGRRLAVLTGAGISTESGIPDYRGPETARRARNPIKFQAFVGDPAARARYWARATVGYPRVAAAEPNAGHRALARLEERRVVGGIITQNVDGLHARAGSRHVVELHGTLGEVACLACGVREDRDGLQRRLLRVNPGWTRRSADSAPDGDAELDEAAAATFEVVGCLTCGGALKPDVVFFGENVPRPRVEAAYRMVDSTAALLIVGSSLTVFSGFRFVKRAIAAGKPVAIVNVGPTRADGLATVKVEGRIGAVLPALEAALAAAG
jgi:NAD-dependent SIR2 family protein deacetylase